ncbi:MAG: oligopeptide ABC transporter permease OppB [Rhodospirillaceae bacterium]|jgi:oligopeptide transport system permease protein|nr:oligopeptide ABC transporter permease OppB [Rhodospirillaceae bacterium]MBT5566892.1 oligopeptide ABC transporter permease OppB [Rhodospirillaceae bacterium]MBT6090421.1 oligopeptide ABC transporter permease OppB [Rhodospirillaceae bacterium]MBT6962363.1 oligopeptide ABC transporter permease OppB [Rhodospirillaceae bacterium]MBT7449779.1 oligopeptide ABC transporter permease OppB [Rhodospirillaceae bacterium]
MWAYFTRRLFIAIPTLWVVITVAFFLMRLAPGGPFDQEAPLPPEIMANLKAAYGLDQPLWWQYVNYLGNLLQGDFGPSFKYKDFSVTELIGQGFPVSIQNGAAALFIAVLIGIPLGAMAALRQNSGADHAAMTVAMTGIVIPNFVVGPLLALIFGIWLRDTMFALPVAGWNNGALPNRILPVICLALPFIAYIARITRASLIETLRTNYVRTARAKGLPFRMVVLRHAFKSAMIPVVTYLGPATVFLLTGSMVIETIFGLPGIGRYFVQGALNRDYTLVMGVTILAASLVIFLNLLVDMAYAWLDPKVRYE